MCGAGQHGRTGLNSEEDSFQPTMVRPIQTLASNPLQYRLSLSLTLIY
jgi:hypothetical protein